MAPTATPAPWQNWARTETAQPVRYAAPRDLAELVATVLAAQAAGLRLRVVGAGHSFTGVAVTDGVLVRLDHLAAVERLVPADDGTTHVTVGAGIRLHALNRALAASGLALPNLGDIDHQSLAGAISTGTHGTGAHLGGLASQVTGLRIVTAAGVVLETSATSHAPLFEAARLGLGSVGVLAAVTLAAVPAFLLDAREEPWPLDRVLEQLPGPNGLIEANDHFEFYWFPHTRRTLTKRNNRTEHPAPPLRRARRWVDDELLANGVYGAMNQFTARVPAAVPAVNAVAARAMSARHYGAPSYDVWLSTAHGRDTAYVAVHAYVRRPYVRYFAAMERIAAAVDGRPHWGKLNWLDADRLAQLYPRFEDFRSERAIQDPGGMFANPYTDRVFGPVGR